MLPKPRAIDKMSHVLTHWCSQQNELCSASSKHCKATASSPENEDEKHEKHAEGGYVVHSLHQHHELAAQCRHETNQFQHTQETECPQHWEAPIRLTNDLPDAMAKKGPGSKRNKMKKKWTNSRERITILIQVISSALAACACRSEGKFVWTTYN